MSSVNTTTDLSVPFELEILRQSRNYQRWVFSTIEPYLGKRIMELGAGIGNMSQWLPERELLLITEADDTFIQELKRHFSGRTNDRLQIKKLDLDEAISSQVNSYNLDTIVSFNVMEHIENDLVSFQEQVRILKESAAQHPKRIVCVVPAHPFAYGSYDRVFGHFRRYSARDLEKKLKSIDPKIRIKTWYFNLISMSAWILNGRILKKTTFNAAQVQFFDRIVPFLLPIDNFVHHYLKIPLGQSLIAIIEVP